MNATEKAVYEAIKESGGESYSGRGMYGKRCIGITTDSISDTLKEVKDNIEFYGSDDEDDSDYADFFSDCMDHIFEFETDNMGLSTIIYWPNIEFKE